MREHLAHALEIGRKVTAKVEWLPAPRKESRLCWIHCTPLLGANDVIGVWMVILIRIEDEPSNDENPTEETIKQPRPSFDAAAIPWDDGHLTRKAKAFSKQSADDRGGPRSKVTGLDDMEFHSNAPIQPKKRNDPANASTTLLHSVKHKAARSHDSAERSGNGLIGDSTSSRDDYTLDGIISRAASESGSIPPDLEQVRPKTTSLRQHSVESSKTEKSPIKMPGLNPRESGEPDTKPVRRTYKSLSPYGVLFQD